MAGILDVLKRGIPYRGQVEEGLEDLKSKIGEIDPDLLELLADNEQDPVTIDALRELASGRIKPLGDDPQTTPLSGETPEDLGPRGIMTGDVTGQRATPSEMAEQAIQGVTEPGTGQGATQTDDLQTLLRLSARGRERPPEFRDLPGEDVEGDVGRRDPQPYHGDRLTTDALNRIIPPGALGYRIPRIPDPGDPDYTPTGEHTFPEPVDPFTEEAPPEEAPPPVVPPIPGIDVSPMVRLPDDEFELQSELGEVEARDVSEAPDLADDDSSNASWFDRLKGHLGDNWQKYAAGAAMGLGAMKSEEFGSGLGMGMRQGLEKQHEMAMLNIKGMFALAGKDSDVATDIPNLMKRLNSIKDPQQARQMFDSLTSGTREALVSGGYAPKQIMSDTAKKGIMESSTVLNVTQDVEDALDDPKYSSYWDPIKGRLASMNPYSVDAQDLNSRLTFSAQIIGKYLEEGVLRAEDVPKYKDMLPKMGDLPEVARRKIVRVRKMIENKRAEYRDLYGVEGPPSNMEEARQFRSRARGGQTLSIGQVVVAPSGKRYKYNGPGDWAPMGDDESPNPNSGAGAVADPSSSQTSSSVSSRVTGNIPQRNNNMGNVKIGGIGDQWAMKKPDGTPTTDRFGHLKFATPEDGKKAFRADLEAKVQGRSAHGQWDYLDEMGSTYATDPKWAEKVGSILRRDHNIDSTRMKLQDIPIDALMDAISKQEGFLA